MTTPQTPGETGEPVAEEATGSPRPVSGPTISFTHLDGYAVVNSPDGFLTSLRRVIGADSARRAVEQQRERYRLQEAERIAAIKKAKETLRSYLTAEQRITYQRLDYIDVIGSAGNHYRIHTAGSYEGNIVWLDGEGVPRGKYCVAPAMADHDAKREGRLYEYLPVEDAYLGQLLALKAAEDELLRIAVVCWGIYPQNVVELWRSRGVVAQY